MITLTTSDGDYRGKTIGSIIRRVYGRKASLTAQDMIVEPAGDCYRVLARAISWTDKDENIKYFA